jgi:hypothetical protein
MAAGGVVLVLALPAAMQLLPAPSRLDTRFATNEGDPVLLMWTMQYETEALLHHPTRIFEGNIFWPRNDAIAWSDNLFAYLPVFGPAFLLSDHNPVLAFNMVGFVARVAGALALFLLARYLLGDSLAALVAATVFCCATFWSANVGHFQLNGFFFVPLGVLALMRFLEARRWRDALALGLCAAGTWLITSYFAVLLAIAVGAFVAVWLVLQRGRVGPRFWWGMALAAVTAGIVVAPTLAPYIRLQRTGYFDRTVLYQADASGLVTFPPSLVYRRLPEERLTSVDKNALFPGAVLVALVTVAAYGARRDRGGINDPAPEDVHARRRRTYLLPLTAAALVCALLMLGPHQWGPIGWPYRAMRRLIPGVSSLRELTRFWVFPLMGLALVAGRGMQRVLSSVRGAQLARARVLLTLLVIAFVWVELVYRPPFASVDRSEPKVAANRVLARLPPGPVTEVPVAYGQYVAEVLAPRQLRSLVDDHPRVEGYSGNFPPEFETMQAVASAFPDPEAVTGLRRYGVRYVVVHAGPVPCLGRFGPLELTAVRDRLPVTPGVTRVIEAGADLVVELAPAQIDRAAIPALAPQMRDVPRCAHN